jgi:3,4-dihydroxyphenylacetate 2,3-dioxygenase
MISGGPRFPFRDFRAGVRVRLQPPLGNTKIIGNFKKEDAKNTTRGGRNMSIMCVLATHSPRIIHQDRIAPAFKGLYDGMKMCGQAIQEFKPDVIVVLTTHWFSTFSIYANGTPLQAGVYTAAEAPENINRMVYKLIGDIELARKIVEDGVKAGLPCKLVNDESLIVDYGTLVPLQYFDPDSKIPVVSLSVCMNSSTEEYIRFGNSLAKTFATCGKRVAFVASGSLAHYHSRNPEDWPTEEQQARDKELLQYLQNGQLGQLKARLDDIAREVRMEGYGYHIASLLGILEEMIGSYVANLIAYGPSSGTGNACMTFIPVEQPVYS